MSDSDTNISYAVTELNDMSTDEIHDEVELILNCSGPEIMELIATDPGYYLDIIARYNKTRDGREVYLPYLCNILITRNPQEYRIKFKLSDNSNWYEVGFVGDNFTEDEVHEAFKRKVAYALDRPLDSHRSMLIDTLQPGINKPTPVDEPPLAPEPAAEPVKSQGDQTKLSKIDRFMGRTPPVQQIQVEPQVEPQPQPQTQPQPKKDKKDVKVQFDLSSAASAMPRRPEQQDARASGPLSELDMLRTLCPEEGKTAYDKLVSLLRSNDLFYQSLIDLLPRLSSGQRYLVMNFLQN